MSKTYSAGGVVMNARGHVALVLNGPDYWGFPKGHIDPGEDALTAARREVTEETGLHQLTLIADLGSYQRPGGRGMQEQKTISMFLFTTDEEDPTLTPLDPDNPAARWVAADAVDSMLTHPLDRAFYRNAAAAIDAALARSVTVTQDRKRQLGDCREYEEYRCGDELLRIEREDALTDRVDEEGERGDPEQAVHQHRDLEKLHRLIIP